jgi:hypothetical protein
MSLTVSPEQLAANRANAANSTGPRTPEGKARSSQNARKHGFTAASFAVGVPSGPLEDRNEVAALREDLANLYYPVNSQELFALERVALAQQAILRAARLEAGFLSNCLGESLDTRREFHPPRTRKSPWRSKSTRPRPSASTAGQSQDSTASKPCVKNCETNPISPGDPTPAPAPAFQLPTRALDYHVELHPLEPIPGGPPCIER